MALGAAAIAVASGYRLGTFAAMGPGMFPMILGGVLVLLGIGVVIEGRMAATTFGSIPLRPMLAMSGGVIAFAVIISRFGLIPALVAMVLLVGLAERKFEWRPMAITLVVLSLCAWLTLTLLPYAFNLRLFVA